MRAWRISNYADLSGLGGTFIAGRWHTEGQPIIYASEHPALAMLETLVRSDRLNLPAEFQLIAIDFPENGVEDVARDPVRPADMKGDEAWSRRRGDAWLRSKDSLRARGAKRRHAVQQKLPIQSPAQARAGTSHRQRRPLPLRPPPQLRGRGPGAPAFCWRQNPPWRS